MISEYIKHVCKIGQGAACCKYLVIGSGGFECAKVNPSNKTIIDTNWATHSHTAQGNNCSGRMPIPDTIEKQDAN